MQIREAGIQIQRAGPQGEQRVALEQEAILACAQEMAEEAQNKNAPVFLATDSAKVREKATARFG
eukprot:CAMPEP_0175888530 /NCGR_PEP_ID=MMETSP0107_2-20121207/46779_1 /TAXON_ID=195067 ORGANISM="Goniomonas pacifica, Strain CCMP1869" /NCGR_SAMPLE_ID=MMETSP0107_2 /ASSEMBLY_ACC=CAM_ASM_000203 /LENGTH=64 /DNA_ID=CAMNT_0017209105 /DNA_START=1 /DNA_END=192 /DNA_ORIENTATION=-